MSAHSTQNGIATATLLALSAAAANGAVATLTADNHYALYTSSPFGLSMVGHGETGRAGSPGAYNWSLPETWEFQAGGHIYVAAWSDDAVAQGLLGHFDLGEERLLSGDSRWQVFATGIDLDTNDPAPSAIDVAHQIALADEGSLWQTPFVHEANGSAPWNSIPGVDGAARWMWAAPPGPGTNTIIGGRDYDEYLIFRASVPAPAPLLLLTSAGLFTLRRRRG